MRFAGGLKSPTSLLARSSYTIYDDPGSRLYPSSPPHLTRSTPVLSEPR
ncbi:hypothetical protein V2J09_000349 [Rumex salicifolius]